MTNRGFRLERSWISPLTVLVSVLLLLNTGPGCKKKEEKPKDKAASKDKDVARGGGDTEGAKTREPSPGRKEPSVVVTVDPDLQKKLADLFGDPKTFDKLIQKVKSAQSTITALGSKGKTVYPLYLTAAESLKKCAELAATKKFADIAPYIISGVVAGTMTVKLLGQHIGSTGKKVARAARSLKVSKAKKLGRYAKKLGRLAKVAGVVLKKYLLALEAVTKSKSHNFRVSAFRAAVKACEKADAVTKAAIGATLRRIHSGEKDDKAKAEMAKLLKSLG